MNQLRVVLARAPAPQRLANRLRIEPECPLEWRERRRDRDDRTNVEIAVGPAVETLANTLGERVVHGGVTERARDSDARRAQAAAVVERLDPHDGVCLEQLERRLHFIQTGRATANRRAHDAGHVSDIDLEAELERLPRRDSRSDAAVSLASDRAMQLEGV